MKRSDWTPLMVLNALADGELHGYAIAQAIREQSGDAVVLNEGLLYPLLHQMERDGLVVSRWDRPAAGRARKYYRLTDDGVRRLHDGRAAFVRDVRMLTELLGVTL
jgi:PadR family transcriptional regulator PadR